MRTNGNLLFVYDPLSLKKIIQGNKSIKTKLHLFLQFKKRGVMSIDNINIMQKRIPKSLTRFKPFCNPVI